MQSFLVIAIIVLALTSTTDAQSISGVGRTPSSGTVRRGIPVTYSWNQNGINGVYLRVCTNTDCSGTGNLLEEYGPIAVSGTSASTTYAITSRVTRGYIVICDVATTTKGSLYLNDIQGQATSVSVTYPSSSITIERGKPITFTWITTGNVSSVDITMTASSNYIYVVRNATNIGAYTWTPGVDAPVANSYSLRISTNVTGPWHDSSYGTGGYISITYPSATITVISPRSPIPTAYRASQYNISWSYTGPLINFNVTFFRSSSSVIYRVASFVTGPWLLWTIPSDIDVASYWTFRVTAADVDPIMQGQSLVNLRGDSGYVTTAYPVTSLTLTSMTSSTSMRPGASQVLTWSFTPDNLVTTWNISLYKSEFISQVGSDIVGNTFRFYAPLDEEGYYYYLRLIPSQVDTSLIGATIRQDTGYITISASGGGSDSGGGGGSGSGIGVAFGAVIFLVAAGAAGWRRWKLRQERREFAKLQGIASAANNPPPPPIADDQYITEGIPLCYFETPHYAAPGAQPAVLLPVSPVGHVVGLAPQH